MSAVRVRGYPLNLSFLGTSFGHTEALGEVKTVLVGATNILFGEHRLAHDLISLASEIVSNENTLLVLAVSHALDAGSYSMVWARV